MSPPQLAFAPSSSSATIHYGKVLTAIGYLLNDEDRVTAAETLDGLRKSWNKFASPSHKVRDYSVHVTQTSGETSVMNADRLAFAWIYGDTIHAGPIHHWSAEIFGIQERFRAATGIVAGLIINTIATLNVVLALNEEGRLAVTGNVLDRDVVEDGRQPSEGRVVSRRAQRRAPVTA